MPPGVSGLMSTRSQKLNMNSRETSFTHETNKQLCEINAAEQGFFYLTMSHYYVAEKKHFHH
jgi:hypothetical protein